MEELDALVFDQIRRLAIDPEYCHKVIDEHEDDRQETIKGEIKKLYLDGNRLMILFAAVIAVPASKWFMDTIFPSFIGNVACAIHLEFPWYLYVLIFAGILAFFVLGVGLSPSGFAFTILIVNVFSLFVQNVENHYLRDFTSTDLMEQVKAVKEGNNA